jgi:TetR/AcrR family transcriptional repressor of nem operon
MRPATHESRTKLLDATLKVVRTKGYCASRIEDFCAEAGPTKGKLLLSLHKQAGLGFGSGGALGCAFGTGLRRSALSRRCRAASS